MLIEYPSLWELGKVSIQLKKIISSIILAVFAAVLLGGNHSVLADTAGNPTTAVTATTPSNNGGTPNTNKTPHIKIYNHGKTPHTPKGVLPQTGDQTRSWLTLSGFVLLISATFGIILKKRA